MIIDDSLLLGYDRRKGAAKGSDKAALSVSACKLILEDPIRFYFTRVLGLQDPPSLPLLFGSAGHAALETWIKSRGSRRACINAFTSEIDKGYEAVPDKTERVNLKDPMNPRDKVNIPVSRDELIQKGEWLLNEVFDILNWDEYSILKVQNKGRYEVALGEIAKENNMPYTEMTVFDPRRMRMIKTPVAAIAGIPFHGYIDLYTQWTDGSPVILDHKFVSSCVPFYPTGNKWVRYEPSYNPADDFQLDIYSVATNVTRSGFQFIMKNPQYFDESGLSDQWVDEHEWSRLKQTGDKMPMAWALSSTEKLHFVAVWRPDPNDHPSRPMAYTRPHIMARTITKARKAAEFLTESLLLLEAGVEPIIAFPPGDPSVLQKKACPFCSFLTQCKDTQLFGNDTAQGFMKRREEACRTNPQIIERRALWKTQEYMI